MAIREDEDAAEALGVDTFRYKLCAIVLSAFLTGLGGAFYANYLFSLQPNAVFGIPLSVDIIIRPVIGGAGTLLGPLLGSLILSPLAEIARIYFSRAGWTGLHLVVYGVLLVGIGAVPPPRRLSASPARVGAPPVRRRVTWPSSRWRPSGSGSADSRPCPA